MPSGTCPWKGEAGAMATGEEPAGKESQPEKDGNITMPTEQAAQTLHLPSA